MSYSIFIHTAVAAAISIALLLVFLPFYIYSNSCLVSLILILIDVAVGYHLLNHKKVTNMAALLLKLMVNIIR